MLVVLCLSRKLFSTKALTLGNEQYNYTLGIVYIFITTYLSTCIVMKQQAVHLVKFKSACIIYNYKSDSVQIFLYNTCISRKLFSTKALTLGNEQYNYTLGIVYIFITTYLSTCIVMKQQAVHLVKFKSACIIYNYKSDSVQIFLYNTCISRCLCNNIYELGKCMHEQ